MNPSSFPLCHSENVKKGKEEKGSTFILDKKHIFFATLDEPVEVTVISYYWGFKKQDGFRIIVRYVLEQKYSVLQKTAMEHWAGFSACCIWNFFLPKVFVRGPLKKLVSCSDSVCHRKSYISIFWYIYTMRLCQLSSRTVFSLYIRLFIHISKYFPNSIWI